MSIVAVHGPNTFGSKALVEAGPVMATASATNGLIWTFRFDLPTTRPDQDFSWAFPPNGTPTPQTVAAPTAVTYATAGSKTATATVTNVSRTVSNKALTSNVATLTTSATSGFKVGQSVVVSGVDATFNGTYTILSTPTGTTFTYACTAANVTSAASGGTVASDPAQYPAAGAYPVTITAAAGAGPTSGLLMAGEGAQYSTGYDPAEHTVAEVEEYARDHPDEVETLLDAEEAGKNRTTLVSFLEAQLEAE